MPHTIILIIPETPAPKGSVKHIGKGKNIDMQAKKHRHLKQTIKEAWEKDPQYSPWLAEYDQPVTVYIEVQIKQPDTAAFKKLEKHTDLVPMPAAKGSHKTTGGDIDKLARAVLDALSGQLFKDDSQVCHLEVYKGYTRGHGGTKITVVYPYKCITAKNYTLKQLHDTEQLVKAMK